MKAIAHVTGMPDYALHLYAAVALLSYLIGSVPFGLVLTALAGGGDIRKIGSGNIGATNVLRTGRKDLAAATLILDGLKGFVAALIAWIMTAPDMSDLAVAIAAVCVVIGHCFPVWLGFRGGKGVATGLGAAFGLSPLAGIACCLAWMAGAKLTRISSVGALAACVALPLSLLAMHGFVFTPVVLAGVIIALLVIARHHGNITRLIRGTEPRIGKSSK